MMMNMQDFDMGGDTYGGYGHYDGGVCLRPGEMGYDSYSNYGPGGWYDGYGDYGDHYGWYDGYSHYDGMGHYGGMGYYDHPHGSEPIPTNHVHDNPGYYTCDCVSPDDGCFVHGHCRYEPGCPDLHGQPTPWDYDHHGSYGGYGDDGYDYYGCECAPGCPDN